MAKTPAPSSAASVRTLVVGTYRLLQDIHNTRGDHRTRTDWTVGKAFQAGIYYVVEDKTSPARVGIRKAGTSQTIPFEDVRFTILARYLVQTVDKISDELRRRQEGAKALSILDALIAAGKVSRDDVRALVGSADYLPER